MTNQLNFFNETAGSDAVFSDDHAYRYCLYRIWDAEKPMVMFIGLNPSTANENKDDATIRRIKSFVKCWRYGGFYMLNLFAFVTAYPYELKRCENPIGDNNNEWLSEISKKCEKIIFCWGSFKEAKQRAKEVIKMFPIAYCLGKNADGCPKHPLYLKKSTQLIKF